MLERVQSERAQSDRTMIEIRDVKRSDGSFKALDSASLAIREGEFFSLLGPSGCGKTTLLRMIAGFDTPTSGSIAVDGQPMDGIPANRRPTNMVFQSYAIFPHLNVQQNVAYGLRRLKLAAGEEKRRVEEALAQVSLTGLGKRRATELSGGQRQRVALARALVMRPKVLLLDEPLSALDAKVRVSLREEIRSIQKKLGITTIFVTHDQEEALSISDRIAVMYGGKAEQAGTPFEIYNRPATKFVANFVGTLNVLEGKVTDASTGKVQVDTQEVSLKGKLNGSKSGDTLSLALRPEAISLGRQPGHDASLSGEIAEVHFLGSVIRVRVGIGGNTVSLDTFNNSTTPPPVVGDKADISFSSGDMLVLH